VEEGHTEAVSTPVPSWWTRRPWSGENLPQDGSVEELSSHSRRSICRGSEARPTRASGGKGIPPRSPCREDGGLQIERLTAEGTGACRPTRAYGATRPFALKAA
jgi:hypothetical protein